MVGTIANMVAKLSQAESWSVACDAMSIVAQCLFQLRVIKVLIPTVEPRNMPAMVTLGATSFLGWMINSLNAMGERESL